MTESFNHFPEIIDAFDQAQALVVKKTAFDCQAHIQSQIRANGQIDTGFMVNGIYVVTADTSTYGQAGSPSGDASLLPEVARPPDNKTAYIGAGANYSIYQNNGTRSLPARPFFEPGVEATRPSFEAAMRAIESQLT
jgi:hypothetical protein